MLYQQIKTYENIIHVNYLPLTSRLKVLVKRKVARNEEGMLFILCHSSTLNHFDKRCSMRLISVSDDTLHLPDFSKFGGQIKVVYPGV